MTELRTVLIREYIAAGRDAITALDVRLTRKIGAADATTA
jgi:hypothetical protein